MNKYKLVINIFYKKILTKEGEITYGERNKSFINCSSSFSSNYNHFSTYEAYAGESQSGTKVKALVDTVYNHNLTESDKSRKIELVKSSGDVLLSIEEDNPSNKPKILTGKRYKVTCVPDKKSGLITKIQIDELSNDNG